MTGRDDLRPSSVWIVHRDPRERAALARLAAAGDNTLLGGPGDSIFESAPTPDVVVLGVAGDFERELEFAHRLSSRLHPCAWIVVAEPSDSQQAALLFEDLPSALLRNPPPGSELRSAIRQNLGARGAQPLSLRRRRDRLTARFSRWFGDTEIAGLMRALDPNLAGLPLLVRGEPGTGRGLIARYVHAFGGDAGRPFVHVACEGACSEGQLLSQMQGGATGASVWLDEVDSLPPALQRHVSDWIEFGLPGGPARLEPVRWMASAWEESEAGTRRLDPRLAQLLSVLSIHTPTLRERPGAVDALAIQIAEAWTSTRGLPARHFADDALEALRSHPWPGNQRELEAVVVRTLSANRSDPIPAVQLRFDAPGEWGQVDRSRPADHGPVSEPAWADSTVARPGPEAAPEPASASTRHELRAPPSEEPLGFDAEALALDQLPEAPPAAKPATQAAAAPEAPHSLAPAMAAPAAPQAKPIDIAALLDGLLDDLRDRIQSRRLLVLKELDRAEPFALGDAEALRRVFSDVLGHALASIPDRGDMYLASSHHPAGLEGRPSVRVLLRFRKPGPDDRPSFDPAALATEGADVLFARAEQQVAAQGGVFTGDSADPRETLVVIDLPAPGPSPEA